MPGHFPLLTVDRLEHREIVDEQTTSGHVDRELPAVREVDGICTGDTDQNVVRIRPGSNDEVEFELRPRTVSAEHPIDAVVDTDVSDLRVCRHVGEPACRVIA